MDAGERIGAAAIAGVVDRPRLYQVLDSTLIRVCVVQGPSGSGKTTLLRSWILRDGDQRRAVTWVSLSGRVTSRHAFWQDVAVSAARLSDLSKAAVAQVREQMTLAVDPVRIASTLLGDAGPVILVLDAYEHLGDVMAEIDEDIGRLVATVPDLRVMITTRVGTALADLDVPDGGIVRMITLGELALTQDEVGALIAAQTGIEDERLAQSVTLATRGYALTVRAVVLALAQLGRIPHLDSMEWDAIVAARLESLLSDPVAVRFVTDTSVPPYVDVELGELLSDNPETARLLDSLERNGFGRWIPYARNHPVFQYVETVRDTFRARASDDEERFRRSCSITAAWLLANDEIDRALQFAIDGADYALADRVFVPLMITNPDSYTSDRFLPMLRRVPEAALPDNPMLAFGLGLQLAANPLLRAEAPRIFTMAIESTVQPSYVEPAVDDFSLTGMRAIARRLAWSYQASAKASLEVLRAVEDFEPRLMERYGEHIGTVLRQLSYSLLQGGMLDEALAAMSRSAALCPSQTTRNYTIVYAAGASAFSGDVARARVLLSSIDDQAWPEELKNTYMNGLGVVAEGFARLDALDFAGAAATLRDTDCYTQTTEFWPFLTAVSVAARHGVGQAQAEAHRVTRELNGPVPPPGIGDNVSTEYLHAVLALAWMAGGDHRAAAQVLEDQPPDSPYLAAARIAWLLGAGRDDEALDRTRFALDLPGHTIRSRAETQTVGAVAALRKDEPELAWDWLNGAAVAWENYGVRMHVATLDPRHRRLLWEFGHERESASLQRYLDVPVSEARASGPAAVSLTPREQVVLDTLAQHHSTRAIAETLVVSPHTVKTQLRGIYRKLGVSSRQSALAVARDLGLLGRTPRA